MKPTRKLHGMGHSLWLDDITRAADLFRPVFGRAHGVNGWVSLEVSPLLAHDTNTTLAVAKELHAGAVVPISSN